MRPRSMVTLAPARGRGLTQSMTVAFASTVRIAPDPARAGETGQTGGRPPLDGRGETGHGAGMPRPAGVPVSLVIVRTLDGVVLDGAAAHPRGRRRSASTSCPGS